MKFSTINQVVQSLLEDKTFNYDKQYKSKRKTIANEAVIYWKTFYIAENQSVEEAMKYFTGTHREDEYQEFRTFIVAPSDTDK